MSLACKSVKLAVGLVFSEVCAELCVEIRIRPCASRGICTMGLRRDCNILDTRYQGDELLPRSPITSKPAIGVVLLLPLVVRYDFIGVPLLNRTTISPKYHSKQLCNITSNAI
jgi:hypothetical protein